jgi:CYTH domain-containing protein
MRPTKIEHERKFLLKELPIDFNTYTKNRIKQWYLTKPNHDVSLRIRLYDDGRCYFDTKRGSGITKTKIGKKCKFEDVTRYIDGAYLIEKDRYKKHCDGYLLIIDFFDNGLKLIEIESDNLDIITNFNVPNWFGEEVTHDINYCNNTMAYKKYLKNE